MSFRATAVFVLLAVSARAPAQTYSISAGLGRAAVRGDMQQTVSDGAEMLVEAAIGASHESRLQLRLAYAADELPAAFHGGADLQLESLMAGITYSLGERALTPYALAEVGTNWRTWSDGSDTLWSGMYALGAGATFRLGRWAAGFAEARYRSFNVRYHTTWAFTPLVVGIRLSAPPL